MSRKTIHLSTSEDKLAELPEEVKRIGVEAAEIIWTISQDYAHRQLDAMRQQHQDQQQVLMQQRQQAQQQIVELEQVVAAKKQTIEQITRANKSLQVDLERENGELKSAKTQIVLLQEKVDKQEHEIRNLIEELGRARESNDGLQKRLYEANRQLDQEQKSARQAQEESAVNQRIKERLDQSLREIKLESDQVWRQLKQEQARTSVAEAQVQELRETIKKLDTEARQLKEEKQEQREAIDAEIRVRVELEKKMAAIVARGEAQEQAHKENANRQDSEVNLARQELQTLRDRLIKTEGALEREKKAVERLETKLVSAGQVSA
jgi:chromosome segregation ATPase